MKYIVLLFRILAGALFVFSGFVKAVDPLGSTYKFTDYFNAFGMPWAADASLALAFILSAVEFLAGLSLLINFKIKWGAWAALLFMLIFTPLTLYLAITNAVSDCGCFGDAMKMTNWQTFYKNLVISAVVVLVFVYRNKIEPYFIPKVEYAMVIVSTILIMLFQVHNYRHLPVIDFRPYKIGTYLPDNMKIPEGAPKEKSIYYYHMKNLSNQEVTRITSDQYLEDTLWQDASKYELLADKIEGPIVIEKGYEPPIHDFAAEALQPDSVLGIEMGTDIIPALLEREGYAMLMVAYDLDKSNPDALEKANEYYALFNKNHSGFYAHTATGPDQIEQLTEELGLTYPFYLADATMLKTIIRANPGFVLLKKGTVINKWHFNDMPSVETLTNEYLK